MPQRAAVMTGSAEDRAGFEIIDAYCSAGPAPGRRPGDPYTIEDLLAEHRRFGIRGRLCVHAEARDGNAEDGNAEMSRLAAAHPGTYILWAALPPRRFRGEPVDSFMARAQAAGVAMFALFPRAHHHGLAPWANGELYSAMQDAGVPLVLSAAEAGYENIYRIASRYAGMPVVLWDIMYTDERFLVPLMDECPNVHAGLATRFIPFEGIELVTGRYGPHRMLFGSNWPSQSPGPLISCVTYAQVDDRTKAAILGENVLRLLSGVAWKVRGLEGGR